MRTDFVRVMAVVAAAAMWVSCGSDKATRPTGPVELRFSTQIFKDAGGTSLDTVHAMVIIDGAVADSVTAPDDTVKDFARGTHEFEAHLDIDYLVSHFTTNIDPNSTIQVLPIRQAGSCRIFQYDPDFCEMGTLAKPDPRNRIYFKNSRLFCPAGDFGEFCTFFTDAGLIGASWPVDTFETSKNEYIAHGKLLIGATGANAKAVATAFYDAGDYAPRVRHHVDPADSSVFQSTVWTDVRHVPLFPEEQGALAAVDRPDNLLGLSVRTTYQLSATHKNALFIRFDVTNISDSADYRRLHPAVPVGGFTITKVYLAPVLDVDVGGVRTIAGLTFNDTNDDNGTYFPADSLVMAYDQAFFVPPELFGGGYSTKPGVVGIRLLEAPAGAIARGLILDRNTNLTYGLTTAKKTLEDSTYRVISAGRIGDRPNCTTGAEAMVCFENGNGEAAHDVRIGWSLGEIASIAPGQTVTLQIAILFAKPAPATFTSGTGIAPDNANLNSTSRLIYPVSGLLRALGDSVKTVRVVGTPR